MKSKKKRQPTVAELNLYAKIIAKNVKFIEEVNFNILSEVSLIHQVS